MESYIDNYEKNDKPEHNSQHVTSSSEFRDDIISEGLSMNIYEDNRESTSGLITPPLTVEKNFDLDSVSFIDEFCFTSHDTLMDEKVVESSEVCSVTSSTLNYTAIDAIESAKSVVNDLINNLEIQTPTSTKETLPHSVIPEMVGLERLKNLNLLSSELFRNILKLEYFSQLTQDSKCLHENTLEIQTLEYFESIIVCQNCNSLFTCTEWHKYCIYGRPIYDCHFCLKKFYKEESLERHLNITHMSDERPYLCLLCEERFLLHKDFMVHLHDHSDNYFLYKCEKCPSRFLTRTHLTVHNNNDHRVKRLTRKSGKKILAKRPRIKSATIDYINKYKYLNLLRQQKTPPSTANASKNDDVVGLETMETEVGKEADSEHMEDPVVENCVQETPKEEVEDVKEAENDPSNQEVIISSIEESKGERSSIKQVTSPSTDLKSVSTNEDDPVISNVTTPPTPAKRRATKSSRASQQRLAQNQSHQQFFLQNQQYANSNVTGGQMSTQFMLLPNGQIVPICATPQGQQGLVGVNASMGNQLLYTAGVQQQTFNQANQQQQQQQLMLPSSYQSLLQAQAQQQQQAQYQQQQQLQALQQQQSQYQQQAQQQQQVIVRGANGQLYAVPLSQSQQQLQYAQQQNALAQTSQPQKNAMLHQQSMQPQIVTLSSSQMQNNPIVAANVSSQSQQSTSTTTLLSNQITTSVMSNQSQNALLQNPAQPQQQQPILFYQPDGQGGAYILSANVDQLSLQQQQQQQQQQFVVLGPGSGLGGGGGTVQFHQNIQTENHAKYHQAQQQTFAATQQQSIQQIHQQNNQELQQMLVQTQSTGPFSVVYPAQSSGLHMQAKIISHPPAHSFACGTPLLLANTTNQSTISNGDDIHQQSQLTQQQSPQQNQIIIQGNGQLS